MKTSRRVKILWFQISRISLLLYGNFKAFISKIIPSRNLKYVLIPVLICIAILIGLNIQKITQYSSIGKLESSGNFAFNEDPIFEFKNNNYSRSKLGSVLGTKIKAGQETKITLLNPSDQIVNGVGLESVGIGKYKLVTNNPTNFVPGRYKLTVEKNGNIETKEFTWGVLAINTNKDVYKKGETAFIQFATLDDKGHTLCNSNLELYVTQPNGKEIKTDVIKSQKCNGDNVIDVPDYFSNLKLTSKGTYNLKLVNNTLGYSITDSIKVGGYTPFTIERTGPTRIYPRAVYKMNIKVTANKNFKGTISEQVPASFKTVPEGKDSGFWKTITWEVNMKKGEIKDLSYTFDAPDVSPELYNLKPLKIGNYSEKRSWQIASDVVGTHVALFTATNAWIAPTGVTTASVEAWGGGGAGGGATGNPAAGGGGAGGTYAKKASFSVTAGNSYTVTVAAAKTATTTSTAATNNGNPSWFSSNDTNGVVGQGGPGGTPQAGNSANGAGGTGSTAASYGDGGSVFAGGNGTTGSFTSGVTGGAGGGGAGTGGAGGNATTGTGGTGTATGGGNGANGVANSTAGAAGTAYGGGGSGGKANSTTDRAGGTGAAGAIQVTYSADFPKIEATSTGRDAGDVTSHPITMPSGITAGELLIIVFTVDGNPTATISSGNWTKLGQASNTTVVTQAIFYKIAQGSDTATVSTGATSEEASHVVYRISGAGGVVTGTSANGSSTNSNPPSHNAVTSGNYLWIATRGGDAQVAPTVPPTNFASVQNLAGATTNGATTSTSFRHLQASTLDPGTWTSATEQWVSYTLAIPQPKAMSGTVYTNETGTNIGANKTVNLRVNGVGTFTDETDANGVWNVDLPIDVGTVVTAYIDNETEEGTSVFISDGTAKTDFHIYQNTVTVRYDTGSSITPDTLFTADDTDDDVKYVVSASTDGNLTIDSGFELHIWTGETFDASGGTVTTQGSANLHVDDSAIAIIDTGTSTIAGDAVVDSGATLRINGSLAINGGDITTSGTSASVTTTAGTPTVTMSGTGTIGGGTTPTLTFYNLNTSGTGTTTLANSVTANNDVSVGSGTTLRVNANLTVSGGDLLTTTSGAIDTTSGTPTVTLTGAGTLGGGSGGITIYNLTLNGSSNTTTLSTNNLIISNALSVGASHVFDMSTNSLTIGSASISDSGDITMATGSSTSQSASGTVTILNTTNAADWSGPGTFTAYNLTIGNNSATMSVDNETSDMPLDVNNTFTNTSNSTFSSSSTAAFNIGNNYLNNGTFTSNTGTVVMDAGDAGNTLDGTMTSTSSFHNLTFNNAAGSWSFTTNATTTGNFTISSATAVTAPSSLTVTENFTGSSAFAGNSGTVTLNGASAGTQTIAGSTTFYNLTATASASRTLVFTASTTTRITNNLTLTGTSCDALILLRSSSKGTTWSLDDDTGGTTSVSYVDVQDSNSTDQAVSATSSSNSGNNTNWTIAASACEGASTSTSATSLGFQRKTIFDETNSRYWIAYHDGDEIEFKYSDDTGTTWKVPATSASGHIAYDTNDFSLWRATISGSEYLYLVVTDGFDVKILVGTLSATDISWDNNIDTVFDGTGTSDTYSYPYVALDTSNYIWIGARYYDGTNYVYKTIDSNATGNTDLSSVGWNASNQITINQTNANVYGNIVPLGSKDMYATFAVGTALMGCMWDDSANNWYDSSNAICSYTSIGTGEASYYDSLSTGLVGYWKMNEGSWNGTTGEVLDETANNLDGTRFGSANTSKKGFKASGAFDGTGDYFSVTDAGTSPLDITGTLSMSAWIYKTGNTPTNGWSDIISKGDSADANPANYWLQIIDVADTEYLSFYYYNTTYHEYRTNSTISLNTWTHIAVTYNDTNNSIKMYINGVESSAYSVAAGDPLNNSLVTNNENFRVGWSGYTGQEFAGNIDEVRVYNTELSGESIQKLYTYRPDSVNIDDASDFGNLPGSSRNIIRTQTGILYAFVNDAGSCEMWKSDNGVNWVIKDSANSKTCDTNGTVAIVKDYSSIDYIEIVWTYAATSNGVMYGEYNMATDTFTGTVDVVSAYASGRTYGDVSIVHDSNSISHVTYVYNASSTTYLYYDNRVGGAFNASDTLIESNATGATIDIVQSSLLINSSNYPEVYYISDNYVKGVAFSSNDSATFSSKDIDTTINTTTGQLGVSAAVDLTTGYTWIAYVDSTNYIALASYTGADYTGWGTGGNWNAITTKTNVGYEPSIAMAGSSDVYVFYQDDSTDQRIAYDMYDSNATSPGWSGENILETPASGVDLKDVHVKWSFIANHFGPNDIDYTYSDGTDVYVNKLYLRRTPSKIQPNVSDLHYSQGRTVVRTSTGVLYSMVLDGTGVADTFWVEIWKSTDGGTNWKEFDTSNTPQTKIMTDIPFAMAIDSSDIIHLLYFYADTTTINNQVIYTTYNTGSDTWGTPEVIDSNTVSGDRYMVGSISIDSNDKPHIFYSYAWDITYQNRISGTWSTPVVVRTEYPRRLDITINEDNIPEVSFVDYTNGMLVVGLGNANNATNFSLLDIDPSVSTTSSQYGASLAIDSSGNTYCAYVNSDSTLALAKYLDNAGKSLDFDGTADYVNVPYNAGFDLTTDLTVMFWFKPDNDINSAIGSNIGLISKAFSNTDANNDWTFFWSSSGGGSMRFGTYGDYVYSTKVDWDANTWYHVAATVTSTNTAYIYINGVQDNAGADTSIATDPINGNQNTPLQIGYSRTAAGDHYFSGGIDDVRIYDTPLSQSQIQATMYSSIVGNESNLVAAWKMDAGSGQDVLDETSNSYDGTLGATNGSSTDDPAWFAQTPIGWSINTTKTDTAYIPTLSTSGTDVYAFYHDDHNNIVYDMFRNGSWTGETLLESLGVLENAKSKWAMVYDYGSDSVNYGGSATTKPEIDYMFYDGTDTYYNRYLVSFLQAGSQDSIDTILSNTADNFSTVADSSNNVHIAYIDDAATDQVSHKKWTNSTKTWGSATLVPSAASDNQTNVSLGINKASTDLDDLYVSWVDSSNNHIYYRQYDSSATSWQTVQDWKTTGSNVVPTLNYGNDGRIFALWTQGNSAPVTADWGSIKAPAGGNSPTVTSVSLNGGSTITLTEGTTTSVSWTGTITDADGNANITSATGKAYRSGVTNAETCTPNDANCYSVASCSLSSCSGNSCTATCTANFAFFADATDVGSTYAAQYWRAWIQGTDATANTGAGFSTAGSPDLASTAGVSITSSIAYDPMLPGDNTGSLPETTTVTNTGNTILDLELSGNNLCTNYPTCSGPQIAVGYQEYKTSTFTYGAGTGLSTTPTTVQVDLAKATAVPSNSTATMYWGLGIPNPKEDGNYTGANTVTAINGGS